MGNQEIKNRIKEIDLEIGLEAYRIYNIKSLNNEEIPKNVINAYHKFIKDVYPDVSYDDVSSEYKMLLNDIKNIEIELAYTSNTERRKELTRKLFRKRACVSKCIDRLMDRGL